ncbi:hypothetical protein ON010_g15022 [Phytophthora cinnamomi]|nr:hypothetical protein ON010_g15022 [Phytophthora cinnamomi]
MRSNPPHEPGQVQSNVTGGKEVQRSDGQEDSSSPEDERSETPLPEGRQAFVRPVGAGKKPAKRVFADKSLDRAISQTQRDLAKAASSQVALMECQLAVAQKKLKNMEEQAEMPLMATRACYHECCYADLRLDAQKSKRNIFTSDSCTKAIRGVVK